MGLCVNQPTLDALPKQTIDLHLSSHHVAIHETTHTMWASAMGRPTREE